MSQTIANTYEILKRIGSGGGGVVYLANHKRLNKTVAVKADKRILTVSPEELNQEVKILTQLHHTYIPQVYDYVYQDGVVYSVIDYIEGESLDKLLERGETVPQPQLIQWAFQLLDALQYLHSTKPHGILHGDIKPANIMVTPEGDIRLIDFNIALALGEKGAVRMGYSEGYASPEHYYSDENESTTRMPNEPSDVQTDPEKTKILNRNQRAVPEGQRKGGVLDARSDIYMLGATLYHLISGVLPPSRAKDVPPLPEGCCDSTVAEIIYKAMAPEPEDRYQTAEEMIRTLKDLYINDPAAKRFKKRFIGITSAIVVLFLLGGLTGFSGLRLQRQAEETARIAAEAAEQQERQAKEQERLAKEEKQRANQALELITAAGTDLEQGAADRAVTEALAALELQTVYDDQAQYGLTAALGVYDLADGFRPTGTVELAAAVLDTAISPSGSRATVIYPWNAALIDTESGRILAEYPVEHSAMSRAVFPNDSVMIFAGEGGVRAVDAETGDLLWVGERATGLACSADGKTVAAVYKAESYAWIYDTETGQALRKLSFGDRSQRVEVNDLYLDTRDNLLALNADGSLLAVSFSDGSLSVFDTVTGAEREPILDPNDYIHFEGGFHGEWLVLCASAGSQNPFFCLLDLEDRSKDLVSMISMPFLVQTDEDGIYLTGGNALVRFDPETAEQTELAYTTEKDIASFYCAKDYSIVATEDSFAFFDRGANLLSRVETDNSCDFLVQGGEMAIVAGRNAPTLRLLRLEQHAEAQLLRYDHGFEHRETRVSADGETVMLFRRGAYQIYSADGSLLTEDLFPDEEQIYDQQFRRDGTESWLEIFYYDGTVCSYSARDGSLISEERGTPYDMSLEEDFYTDRFHIHTRPHEAPQVYELETGALVGELEKEDGLTYVTQVGEYFIAEYITTLGERYGLLMNDELQVLARLPYLCDYLDGMLYFDYPSGDLRRCPLYDRDALLQLARERLA